MDEFEFDFGKIILIQDNIAEVIMNNGIEMDLAMINELHKFLISRLRAPFSLLINKINSYTYSFEAQKQLGAIVQMKAIAVVAYRRSTILATQSMLYIRRETPLNLKIFTDHDTAAQWLISEQRHSIEETRHPQYIMNHNPLIGT